MNWKCPQCGSVINMASELRCACGNEISEEELQHFQFEIIYKKPRTSPSLKNAIVVILISLAVNAVLLPFGNVMPTYLSNFMSHEATLVGYFIILKYEINDNPFQIWKVVIWVWLLMASIYTLAFLHEIGSKYTATGIIGGGLKSEIISVAIALSLYGASKKFSGRSTAANG